MNEEATLPAEVSLHELSRGDWRSLIWGVWWRGFVFLLATTLAGALVGAVIGVGFGIAAAVAKAPVNAYTIPLQICCVVAGLALAIWSYRFYITWVVRARYGSLRLALVRVDAGSA